MQTRNVVLLWVFTLNIYSCCDVLHYSSFCIGDQISMTVSFESPFDGTIFANGHIGNQNCSSPNMEISSSKVISFNLSFMDCNTRIKRFVGERHLRAMNTITIQYHPLIKSELDCEMNVSCDINYRLPSKFLRSSLTLDLIPSTEVKSKLDIMSGENLFGDENSVIANKQFLVLNITDGGRHNHVRLRKCYAHARNVIDQMTNPDLLLNDNLCLGYLDSLHLKIDKTYSDLRDFSEVQNFEISFSQKSFYITCAFDLCSGSCPYFCIGETETNKSSWSTVRTHQVQLFDKSFKGFRNRETDLRTSIRILSDRLIKLKNRQIVLKANTNSKRRRLDETGHAANNTFLAHQGINDIQLGKSKILNMKDISKLSLKQVVIMPPSNHFPHGDDLNISDTKITGLLIKRSETEMGTDTNESDKDSADSLKFETLDEINTNNDDFPELENDEVVFETATNNTDCFNTSGRPRKDTVISDGVLKDSAINPKEDNNSSELKFMNNTDFFNIGGASEVLVTSDAANNTLSDGVALKLNETTNGISMFNFEASNDGDIKNFTVKDCVPYIKFVSVTASLSVLCASFFLITLFLILYTRKERKRHNHIPYLYNQF